VKLSRAQTLWLVALLTLAVTLAAGVVIAETRDDRDARTVPDGITPASSDPSLCVAPTDGWMPCGTPRR
jgi:hypothetical protein